MDRLEDENIVIDILTRLPIRSLMRCSCVCKHWRNLARDRQFIRCHLNRSAQDNPSLILQSWNHRKIYFLDHNETHDYTCTEVRLPPIGLPIYKVLISSCYGLCVISCQEDEEKTYYVFNPITGSYLRLPDLPDDIFFGSRWVSIRMAIGFSSENNEYKVVAMKIWGDGSLQPEVFVHTVGNGGWRGMGHVPYIIKWHSAVFVYGALHWVYSSPANFIVSFNVTNEVFEVIPHPEEIITAASGEDNFVLAVLKGCLSITDSTSRIFDCRVDIWIMKEYGVKESWTKIFSINLIQADQIIGNFDKTYILPPRISNLKTLCFQKNGELLILDTDDVLQSYNPQTMAMRKLSTDTGLPYWSKALTHVGSVVSF